VFAVTTYLTLFYGFMANLFLKRVSVSEQLMQGCEDVFQDTRQLANSSVFSRAKSEYNWSKI
jgi:hypothetical protein